MDTTALQGLGFSKSEVIVYVMLVEAGSTKVGPIIDKSGLASSVVHRALNSLIDKGLVKFIKKGKIKYYEAVEPKALLDYIEDKKLDVLSFVKELETKKALEREKQEAEIYEGTKGITSLLYELIENTKQGEEYLFFTVNVEEKNEEIQKFFIRYDAKRKEKGLLIKGLAPKSLEPLFKQRKYLKMKFTDYPIPSNISICNNKVAIFSWGEKPVGYLIKSKQVTKMFTDLFNTIWQEQT